MISGSKEGFSASWHFEPELKVPPQQGQSYQLIMAALGKSDVQKVFDSYEHDPVPGYDIGKVEVIYNPKLNRAFALRMDLLEGRQAEAAFAPQWDKEPQDDATKRSWRTKIHQGLQALAQRYGDKVAPHVKLLPLWHGTKQAILDSLFKNGYANLATTDDGFFGKGIYSAHEASYAYRVYSQGALLLNWVAIGSAYPVIHGDMPKLQGKANYQNYDTHYAPVVPRDPSNPQECVYYPTRPEQKAVYTEVVVFNDQQCLPRYLVTLQPKLPGPVLAPVLPPEPEVDPAELKTFLKCVVEGEQDQAESMLQKNKNLTLAHGGVKDLSEREFKHITGFQYAVWALDWHMWTMLQKYMPEEAQAKQIRELEDKGTEHGKEVNWNKLIDALTKYIEEYHKYEKRGYQGWDHELMSRLWQKGVGGAQRLLPVHVVNEYCRRDRSFDPCPTFEEKTLPRSRETDKGEWFTCRGYIWWRGIESGGLLGVGCAAGRGRVGEDACMYGFCSVVADCQVRTAPLASPADRRAVTTLWKTRTQQAVQLKASLLQSSQKPAFSPVK